MRNTRRIIFSAFVLGGLALGCTGTAHAADAKLLQPNSNWSVSKIDAEKTKKGEAYCALARRYENDMVLTFARNGQDESSVALDFQKQTLNPLRSYDISLNPGYGQDRKYDIKPVSGGALVVRLGKDYAFFDALGRSGRLDIKIDDEEHKFNLPDFLGGQGDLNNCLGKLPAKTASVSGDSKVSPDELVSTPAKSGLSEMEKLKQENLRLRTVIERERRQYEDRYMTEGMDSSAVSELSEKIRLLEIENGQLHVQLSRLKEGMAVGESCSGSLDDDAGKLTALQDENSRLKESLKEQSARLALLESDKGTDKKKDTRALKDDMAALKNLRMKDEEISALKAENIRLQGELDAIRSAGEDARINISSKNWNLEKATRRFNEAEREIRRLGSLLEDERAKCTKEKREIEYMLFDPEIADKEQTAKLLELENKLEKANAELARQKDTYKDRIKYLEEELENKQPVAPPKRQMVTSVSKQPLPPAAGAPQSSAPDIPLQQVSPSGMSEGERADMLRRISQLQQENTRLRAETYRSSAERGGSDKMQKQQMMQSQQQIMHNQKVIMQGQQELVYSQQRQAQLGVQAPAPVPQQQMPVSRPELENKPMQRPEIKQQSHYMNDKHLQNVLSQAGIETNDGVVRIDVGNKDTIAHSWSTGHMFGSAEQTEMNNPGRYDSLVVRYLGKTEGRCPGDFASVPSAEKQVGYVRVSTYEIACVGQENSASAAILFYSKDGMFTAIAHETTVDGMDIAMDTRDRLFDVLARDGVTSQ